MNIDTRDMNYFLEGIFFSSLLFNLTLDGSRTFNLSKILISFGREFFKSPNNYYIHIDDELFCIITIKVPGSFFFNP